jgi:hypothetical protein
LAASLGINKNYIMCMMLNADNCIDEKLLLVDYKPDFDVA